MKIYKHILPAIILIFIFSCNETNQIEKLKKEYHYISNVKNKIYHLNSTKGKEYTYFFLDSLENITKDKATRTFLELEKLYRSENTQLKDKLFDLKNNSDFEELSPLIKYEICTYLSYYYKIQENSQSALDILFEAISYIEPYEEIYSKEICGTYLNISAYSSLFFNEHQSGEKTNEKGLEIALKYGHTNIASKFIFNENVIRISNKEYKEAIENAYKSIELGKNDNLNEQLTNSYILIRASYTKLEQRDSVKMIDEELKNLFERKELSEELYVYYLLFALKTDLEKSIYSNIHHFEYLESHLLSQTPQNNYFLLVLYQSMAKYSLIINDLDKQIKYCHLVETHYEKMYPITDEILKEILLVYKETYAILEQKKDYPQLIIIQNKIDRIDSIRYSLLEKETETFEKQIKFWAQKDIETAKQQTKIQTKRARLWIALFSIVAIFGVALSYLIRKVRQVNKIVSKQKKEIEKLVNSIPIGLCKIDRNYNIEWANDTIKELFKIPNSSAVGKNYKEILSPSMFNYIKKQLDPHNNEDVLVIEGAINDKLEVVKEFKEGVTWIREVYIPVKNTKGDIDSFIVLNEDHTKEKLDKHILKKQKDKIETINCQLTKQSKMISEQNAKLEESNENLSQFASIAAHDLKAPLRTISSFSTMLYNEYKDVIKEDDKELFKFIVNDSKKLGNMIEGLLNYSRISGSNLILTDISLENIVNESINKLNFAISESGAKIILPEYYPKIKGHLTLLEQVFQNLLNNSLKFKKENTIPIIVISISDYDKDFVLISITDNGIGIDKQHHDKIFKLFMKLHTNEHHNGTGIGLSTCKKIIESCGGEIWIKSKLGEGSSFNFTLRKASS